MSSKGGQTLKRIFYSIYSLIIALSLTLPAAAPAFADDGDGSTTSRPAVLMIKVKNVVETGQPVTITVFNKYGNSTVAGARVYALKTSDITVSSTKNSYADILAEYEALAEASGIYIGPTGDDGNVTGKFTDTGRYMLVATKDGFIPGFTRLTVTLAAKKGLNIKAPGSAEVSKPVTFTVYERYTQQPVAGAAVYAQKLTAVTIPPVTVKPQPQVISSSTASTTGGGASTTAQAEASVSTVAPVPMPVINATVIKADPANSAAAVKYAAEVKAAGILLGYTGDNGQLVYSFPEAGQYVIVATKDEYSPAIARLNIILADQKKLYIKSPGSAEVGTTVNFIIIERSTGQGVSGAGLWALRTNDITGTAEQVWESLASGTAAADVVEKYRGWAKDKGIFLGYSGDSGEVSGAFKETGRYLLVAYRDGHAPGFNRINITLSGQKQLGVKAPHSAQVNQSTTIKVFDASTGAAVENAGVYAFRPGLVALPPVLQKAPPVVKDGKATQVIIDASLANAVSQAEAEKLVSEYKEKAVFIGNTGSGGEVQYAFTEQGLWIIVAVKDGYNPGGARINIVSQGSKKLEVGALFNISVGQPVFIRVWERGSNAPVARAAVYVLKVGEISDVPTVISNSTEESSQAAKARESGALAGYTDEKGQLAYTFGSSGRYILAAFKDGYDPGFTHATISVPVTKKALIIKAQPEALVGETVNVLVIDGTGKGEGKVALYAIKMDAAVSVAEVLKSTLSFDAAVREKYAPLLRERSSFVGYTDENGKLQVRFNSSGAYLLVAIKDGFVPDFFKINIKLAPVPQVVPKVQQTFTDDTSE
jgi:uncharacterized GH25 family protein